MNFRNPFWRNTRTEKHRPDPDPLNTDDTQRPPAGRGKCVCEFCGCQLTPNGEVMKMGDKAREFRRHEEVVEKKQKEIERLNTELTETKRERDELKAKQNSGSEFRPWG